MKETDTEAIPHEHSEEARQVKVYKDLAQLAKDLILEESADDIAGLILSRARQLTGSEFGYVGQIDAESGDLICSTMTTKAFEEFKIDAKKLVFSVSEFTGLRGWVLKNKKSLISNNPKEDPRASGAPLGHLPLNRFLSVPVIVKGRLVGQISLANAPEDYGDHDLQILEELAEMYGIAFQRGKKIEKLQLFHLMTNSSADGLSVIDPLTSRFLEINEATHRHLGYSCAELLAKRVIDISATDSDMDKWAVHIRELREVPFLIFEGEQVRKDGTILPVEINVRLVRHNNREYVVSVARDITERIEAAQSIAKEKNKLEAVLAGLGDGLTMQDRQFRVLYQNTAHQLKQGDCRGQLCYEAYRQKEAICEGCILAKCFADGEVHHKEAFALDNSGTMVYMEVSASPVRDASGQIYAGIETIRDITPRKLLEVKLRQPQKHEAIGTLAGGIAHDFNNILSVIMGYGELVQMDLEPESNIWKMQEQVMQASRRARDLVKQILAFSRHSERQLIPLQISIVVKETLKMLRSSLPSTIEINENVHSDAGLVMADPTQVHQILMNLCTNAYHAMRTSGGVLTVGLEVCHLQGNGDVHLEADISPGKYVLLSVRDTGKGIEKAEQQRIFDPYYSTKPRGEGTGLGLAVVQGIVLKCKGYIALESEPGKGTEFKIYLPCSEEKVILNGDNERDIPRGDERILIVDDEENVVNLEQQILTGLGYHVVGTTNSEQALKIVSEEPDSFDLIITDMTMPGMTGAVLAEKILAIRANMPIILSTGYSDLIDKKKAKDQGICQFLMKPIVRKRLATVVRKVLDGN